MDESINEQWYYTSRLMGLITFGLGLILHLGYLCLSDPTCFPINTVKISASYEHITRQHLESILTSYLKASFFSFSAHQLRSDLLALDWSGQVRVERVWPDTLTISLVEKTPVAVWNGTFMTADGVLIDAGKGSLETTLPRLSGSPNEQLNVLQVYQKLSTLLKGYGLKVASLHRRNNQAWELSLTNGIHLQLGKHDIEEHLQRFCRAYPAVFADKLEQPASVDLRYARGMAVQWKQKTPMGK